MVLKIVESPLDCKEIQPVNPKGNQSEYSLEGLMLKLKLQSFGHLMRRTDSLEETLMLGKIEGGRRRGQQRIRWSSGGGLQPGQGPGDEGTKSERKASAFDSRESGTGRGGGGQE